jgi:hypothetical protein
MLSTHQPDEIRKPFQILFIFFVCLGIYYPAIFNSTLTIDDVDVVRRMQDATFSWTQLFQPRSSFYYRPLIIFTYWVDKWLWDFSATFMLMENMFLHAFNAVFVYLITARIVVRDASSRFIPLIAGLVFAVHPIATESVNWASGRSDLLAGFFVLFSIVLLCKALDKGSWGLLSVSLIVYICAIMSKEIFVFFFPAAGYLIWTWINEQIKDNSNDGFSEPWKPALLYTTPVFLCGAGYVVWRMFKYGASSKGLSFLLERIPYEGLDIVRVVFKVYGFYVKKIFIPQPLNFAIIEVSNFYVVVGVVAFLLTLLVVRYRSVRWGFIVAALYMIIPAILVALTNVAWTPLAERYIYFSTALSVIGLASLISLRLTEKKFTVIALIAMLIWMVPAVYSTVQRNILWQDKEKFYARAIELSPRFNKLRNEYGIALLRNNEKDDALKQFSLGKTGHGSAHAVLNEARMLANDDHLVQALTTLTERYPDVHKMNERALRLYAVIRAKMLRDKDFIEDKDALYRDVQDTYALIFKKTKDPLYLYRSGQIALSMKNFGEAQQLFQEAFDKSPEDAYYKKAAGKLARKMEAERE